MSKHNTLYQTSLYACVVESAILIPILFLQPSTSDR